MKKAIVGVVVLLAAALIGLKYFSSKKLAGIDQSMPKVQSQEQGVSLPSGSSTGADSLPATAYSPGQATGTYDFLTLPPAALSLKGTCDGGSPKEILESHGKVWGYFTGRRIAFPQKRTQEIYNFIGDYYACLAIARQDASLCNDLPGETQAEWGKVSPEASPLGRCRPRAVEFLFKAYVAGKAKDQQNCINFLSDSSGENLSKISPPDFCAAAGQGPDKILSYLKAKLPEAYPSIEKYLGFNRQACGSNRECLAGNDLLEGIRTANPAKCPSGFGPDCAALAQKSQVPCAEILANMSEKYCSYRKELQKMSGGTAGMTGEEVKEAAKLEAAKRAEAENLRKIKDAATKEVNERARKMMGKKGE